MNRSRRQLKNYSILVLILAGITALNIIFEFFLKEINNVEIPEGSPQNILLTIKIVLAVMSFITLLPHIYIGIKGIRIANAPDSSKGHIIWGVILLAFTVASLMHPVIALIKLEAVFANAATLLSVALEALIMFGYVRYASLVSRGN